MWLVNLLSEDDWIYTGILLSSFILSIAIKTSQCAFLHRNGGVIGFSMALLVLGNKILFSIPLALFAALSIKLCPKRHLTTVVFIATFAYLLLCRHLHSFVDIAELASQANGLQLLMSLRVIGLAFEVSDSRRRPHKGKRYLSTEPSYINMFNYFYHFCGLFTGPYYTYQMLLDSQSSFLLSSWSPRDEVKKRLAQLAWAAPIFVVVNHYFPLDGLRTDDVWEWSLAYRLYYAAMVFVVFRHRVYSAWAVSESICVTMCIGIYPVKSDPRIVVGPTNLAEFKPSTFRAATIFNSEAITNLDIWQVELSEGFRKGIRAWNMSVQSWLALFVHSRLNELYRVELTMFVSALWHGTYAGYFMSFLIIPMCVAVENKLFSFFGPERPAWFVWIYVFTLRSRGFDFLATGFLLKNLQDTHRFWSSLYYWLPLSLFPLYALHKLSTFLFRTKFSGK